MTKNKPRGLCGGGMSDLLLLAMQKDNQIKHGEVIRLFKDKEDAPLKQEKGNDNPRLDF